MDSKRKPLPSPSSSPPPPSPPPPPPKNGNILGHPPLLSTNLHDEDGGAVGAGAMETAALYHGSPRASRHELFGSGRRLEVRASSHLEKKMPPRSLVGCPDRDEQRGPRPRYPRVVARLRSGLGSFPAVEDRPYTCADCSMTFGRETALCGHMRSHKRDRLSSESEEDAPALKRRKKRKPRIVKPLQTTWGSTERHNGCPKSAPSDIQHDLDVNNRSGNDKSMIVIDDDDGNAIPIITAAGSQGSPGLAPDTSAAFAMAPAHAVAVATATPPPHAAAASANIEGTPAQVSTVVVTNPQATAPARAASITRAPLATDVSVATETTSDLLKGSNGSGEAHARINAILALPAPRAPVHQPPEGTMAMADNHVTGHFSAANTSTGCSLRGTTSSVLPAILLHDQEQNPPEQMVAGAPGNHGDHSINSALFSLSRRQEITVAPSNAIASSSSTPRPGIVAATEPNQAVGINRHFAPIDAPANTMGRRLPFFLAGRSNTQAFPVSWPVQHPTQGITLDGNPLIGHFPATISATGRSFPATSSSVLSSIPVQNQEGGCHSFNPSLLSKRQDKNPLEEVLVGPSNVITSSTPTPRPSSAGATEPYQSITQVNSNAAAVDTLANDINRLPFFLYGRSPIQAPPMSMPVHQPTQGIAATVGNPMIHHFQAAMAGNGCSFPAITSSDLPTISLQTQEENPPQGIVVPANELVDPSQNQAENQPEGTVPGNNRGRTIRLFGTKISVGQKDVKGPMN